MEARIRQSFHAGGEYTVVARSRAVTQLRPLRWRTRRCSGTEDSPRHLLHVDPTMDTKAKRICRTAVDLRKGVTFLWQQAAAHACCSLLAAPRLLHHMLPVVAGATM
ncbi:unnamed protein product [Urochloa humidicola]